MKKQYLLEVCLKNDHPYRTLKDQLEKGDKVVSATPVLRDGPAASYTRSIIYILERDVEEDE